MGPCLCHELDGIREGDVIFVVLLEQVLRGLLVGANGSCLPATIVAAGVALVQLEASVVIPVTISATSLICQCGSQSSEQPHM